MADTPSPSPFPLPTNFTRMSNRTLFLVLSTPSPRRPVLPHELILQILSHPSRWVLTSTFTLSEPVHVTYRERSKVLLRTPPFTAESLRLFRKIVFTFCSRDQGWSSYQLDHGTYENCWSWFDVAIENNGEEQERGVFHDLDQSNNRRCLLQKNRHAGLETEVYSLSMDKGQGILKDLGVGDEIMLIACARFGGWANNIKEAMIEIWEVDELKEDFDTQR